MVFSLDTTHVLITNIANHDGIMEVFIENISGLGVGEWQKMVPDTIYLNMSDGCYYEINDEKGE